MPTTITSSKVIPTAEPSEIDSRNRGIHERTWRHFASDQTEVGGAIILLAQALSGDDRCPDIGEAYNYGGLNDAGAYCQRIRAWRPEPAEHAEIWHITASFMPLPENGDGIIGEPDPLLWPTVYDVDYLEEQVPLEEAINIEALEGVRAASTLGPVVNAIGVEFTEPLLTTVYYPVLLARKNYATLDEIVALNTAFQKTQSNDTFFGATSGKSKYITTESGGEQKIGATTYYPGTTKILIKDAGWDRQVLNNGWGHFRKSGGSYILDSAATPKIFKNKVHDDPAAAADAEPDADCAEPLNLNLDGTLIAAGDAVYITYRELNPVAYSGIGIGGS